MTQELLEPRDRRLVRTALILVVVALALVVGGQIAGIFYYFGDIVLTFFLAWLIAFVISPAVNWLIERIPGLPQAAATVLVYAVLVAVVRASGAGSWPRSSPDFAFSIDSRSAGKIRPCPPLPWAAARSIPRSRAIFRTRGDASTRFSTAAPAP